jgi:hypothetical protein
MKRSLLSVLAALPVLAGDFINLTFDEPDLSGPLVPDYPDGPLRGGVAKLLRGWTVQANGQHMHSMLFSPFPPGVGGSDLVNLAQNRPVIRPSWVSPPFTLTRLYRLRFRPHRLAPKSASASAAPSRPTRRGCGFLGLATRKCLSTENVWATRLTT